MLTSANTVLVIGTDTRPPGSKEPGANTSDAGSRSDTIMLWRIGGGTSRRLSIPRDTVASIPGHGTTKINAAYAYGGPALAIKTIEQFTGLKINHLILVNFVNFPKFIDALGGVDVTDAQDLLGHQRRHQERRLLAVSEPRHASPERDPGPDAGPHPREQVQPGRERPHPRPPPAADPQRDQVPAALAGHLLPAALGLLDRAAGDQDRHGRPDAAQPRHRRRGRRLGARLGADALRRRDAPGRRVGADGEPRRGPERGGEVLNG